MDSLIDDFVRRVLDYRHTQPSVTDVLRLANHLRSVTQPQLEELERLRAASTTTESSKGDKR